VNPILIDKNIRTALPDVAGAEPEAVCSVVMAAMIGSKRTRDDIALLVLRRRER